MNFQHLIRRVPSRFWKVLVSLCLLIGFLGVIRLFSFSTASRTEDELYQKYFSDNYRVFAVDIPNDLNFCGEQVPLQDFEVRERIDREFLVNTYWQSQTMLLAKRSNRWLPLIAGILKKNGIPDDFKYVPVIESGFMHGVSQKGAAGYWQFIPSTAQELGLTINDEIDERYHVERSTEAACRFFKQAYEQFGNWTLVLAAYNMGINGLARQLARQSAKTYYDLSLNEETSRYVFRLLAVKEILSRPEKYGFNLRKKDLYPPLPFKLVKVDSSIGNLTAFAEQLQINFKLLKYFNPWLRGDQLSNAEKKVFQIKIPGPQVKDYERLLKWADEEAAQFNPAVVDSVR